MQLIGAYAVGNGLMPWTGTVRADSLILYTNKNDKTFSINLFYGSNRRPAKSVYSGRDGRTLGKDVFVVYVHERRSLSGSGGL